MEAVSMDETAKSFKGIIIGIILSVPIWLGILIITRLLFKSLN
jgi:hypothetical protein